MGRVEFRFEPAFVEETVFLELRRLAESGEGQTVTAFQRERAAVYGCEDAAERDARFQQLAMRSFESLGMAALFTSRLEEFPGLRSRLEIIVVRRAWSRKEERAEFYASQASPLLESSATLLIGLQAGQCLDRNQLVAFLRHELMHVADMLDPRFAYDPHATLGGAHEVEDDLIRERFRLLWDLWVHRRVRRLGWPTVVEDGVRRQEYERAFRFLEADRREVLFSAVSTEHRWTQQALLALARDERLTRMLGAGGVRCPLCHFPTHEGVRVSKDRDAALIEAIHAEFPSWNPAQGTCLQCAELYRSRQRAAVTLQTSTPEAS